MANCVYCGKPVGVFARRHPECRPRLIDDRRWCAERRLEERRAALVPVAWERRLVLRREPGDRRSGRERRALA